MSTATKRDNAAVTDAAGDRESGATSNPFQYTGIYRDAATGLYQMGARYYQPASGRFTQLDPHPGQLLIVNRYAYTGCNPTNYTDPTGLSHCDPGPGWPHSSWWPAASSFSESSGGRSPPLPSPSRR